MALTWQQARDYYRLACGNSTAAMHEEWVHLNASLQWLCDQVEVAELMKTATVGCNPGVDWVPLPADLYSVYSVVDTTGNYRLDPEPGGMRGRTRYVTNNGLPVSGPPRYWARLGTQLYLRDMPNATDTLLIYYKVQPATIDGNTNPGNLSLSPIVPAQYHWPLVWYAASNYYTVHPDEDTPQGQGQNEAPRSASLLDKANAALGTPPSQHKKEDVDRREWTRLMGYSANVSGR